MTTAPLGQLPFIIYGTTKLGDVAVTPDARIELAIAAMRKGIHFHTSTSYGEAVGILAQAFAREPKHVPKLMIKIFGNSMEEMRGNVIKYIKTLGIPRIEIAQLCPGAEAYADLGRGGSCYHELKKMKDEGLVKHYVLETFQWTSPGAYLALKGGHLTGTVDALAFYFNPLQRFASNELWDLVQATGMPWIALRTVGGGDVHQMRDIPGKAYFPYLRDRSAQVAPIYERSGIPTWAEFCVRFAASFDKVQATVGASGKLDRLEHLIDVAQRRQPLPADIIDQIQALQRYWSSEIDVKSEPWTM